MWSVDTETYLLSRWGQTLKLAGVELQHPALIKEIIDEYDYTGRYYHTKEHLRSMFRVYDRFFKDPNVEVEFAIWYHDFFYDVKSKTSEARSAEHASDKLTNDLKLPLDLGIRVGKLILSTQYQVDPKSRDKMILRDVELSIFGEFPEFFDEYEENIRREYSFVPIADFRVGRAEILQRFLRPVFYSTPELQTSPYEGWAQSNIRRSLEKLKAFNSQEVQF